ncbi:MAG TPA: ATP-binding protein [Kofleriaceae bacterium]|nr:ATP-binding protein [Kofleriaceae bacterium]
MKLRDRLIVFSAGQLAVFGVLFACGYVEVRRVVLPMLQDHLRARAAIDADALAAQVDLALGAADDRRIAAAVAPVARDADFAYVAVVDAERGMVFERGERPVADMFAGPANHPVRAAGVVRTWTAVELSGVRVGSIAIAYSTARIDALASWLSTLAIAMVVAWLAACAYALAFARRIEALSHEPVAQSRVAGTAEVASGQGLAGVARRLFAENARLRDELASVVGAVEDVTLYGVIDDALAIAGLGFAPHIAIVRQFDELPDLATDRHRLLQIVVNLVAHARHALESCGRRDGLRLVVRVQRRADRALIVVEDNGAGAAAEQLAAMFEVTPSGSGLHTSASAARELGGALTAASDGPGKGETLTLELPLELARGTRVVN